MKLFSLLLLIISLAFLNCSIHTQPVFVPLVYYADIDGYVVISEDSYINEYLFFYGGIIYISYPGVTKYDMVGDERVSGNKSYYYYSFKDLELDYDVQDVTLRFYAFDEYDDEILYKTITVTIDEGSNHIDIPL